MLHGHAYKMDRLPCKCKIVLQLQPKKIMRKPIKFDSFYSYNYKPEIYLYQKRYLECRGAYLFIIDLQNIAVIEMGPDNTVLFGHKNTNIVTKVGFHTLSVACDFYVWIREFWTNKKC
jgi:hypothetical protein